MGDIRKINDEYYIEFHARGLLYRQKAGKDIARARQLLREVESRIQQGEMGTLVRDVDVDIFFQTFLENARQEYVPRSFRRFEALIGNFHGFLKKEFQKLTKLSGVTPAVIDSYRAFLIKPAPSSPKFQLVNFTLLLLRVVFDHGLKLGYSNDNPTLHACFCKVAIPRRPLTLTDRDIEALLKDHDPAEKELFVFLSCTGLRLQEALDLKWQNVDFPQRSLKIAPREIPMDTVVQAMLQERFASDTSKKGLVFAVPGEKLEEHWTRLVKSGKWKGSHLSILRRSFVRRLLEQGVAPVRVCRLMGFDDIARIMYYWQWVPVDKKFI